MSLKTPRTADIHHEFYDFSSSAPRSVTILGSTGSIGANTVKLIQENPDLYEVKALVAKQNVSDLVEQAKSVKAEYAVIEDEAKYAALKKALEGTSIKPLAGKESVLQICEELVDFVMAAISGLDGLEPTYTCLSAAKIVAIANKECFVSAGPFLFEKAKKHNTIILPVDSEHNALAQIYDPFEVNRIQSMTITASGGPFLNTDLKAFSDITVEQALKHPNWSMGVKNTIDSATLMNKGLEVIETHAIFDIDPKKIDVVVHPQSIIHGMITYQDGSVLAQLSNPDMSIPISYCLSWPFRTARPNIEPLDLVKLNQLTFQEVDDQKFPALRLCYDALEMGLAATTSLNAANEICVAAFVKKQIKFTQITEIVAKYVESSPTTRLSCIDDVCALDKKIRHQSRQFIQDNFS